MKKIGFFTLFILFFFSISCSNLTEQNSLFKDTYIEVLSKEIFKFRNIRPPSSEEFKKGIRGPIPSNRDTLNSLKLYIQKEHLKVSFNEFNVKLPNEYMFAYDTTNRTEDYLPENIQDYSTKEYEFLEFDNLDEVFKNDEFSLLNFGGTLQFSKVLLNKEYNKGLLFVRDSRDQLDSVESLILLEKVNGKWKVQKSIVISFA